MWWICRKNFWLQEIFNFFIHICDEICIRIFCVTMLGFYVTIPNYLKDKYHFSACSHFTRSFGEVTNEGQLHHPTQNVTNLHEGYESTANQFSSVQTSLLLKGQFLACVDLEPTTPKIACTPVGHLPPQSSIKWDLLKETERDHPNSPLPALHQGDTQSARSAENCFSSTYNLNCLHVLLYCAR